MYTKKTNNPFNKNRTYFYKNGKLIAFKDDNEKIEILWTEYYYTLCDLWGDSCKYNTYRLAYGWRYWKKHFPERSSYQLPAEIEELLNLECDTYGTYVDKKTGETIAYVG